MANTADNRGMDDIEKIDEQIKRLRERRADKLKARQKEERRKENRRKIILGALDDEEAAKAKFDRLSERDQKWMREKWPEWCPVEQAAPKQEYSYQPAGTF